MSFMLMKKGILISQFFIFLTFYTSAQTLIKGSVKDLDTKKPVEFAALSLHSLPDSALIGGTLTDQEGRFSFEKVKKGYYYLNIKLLGYQTVSNFGLQVDKFGEMTLDPINLSSSETSLESISIEAQRISTNFDTQKLSFSAANFENAKGGTASDILKNLPGVSINGEGEISVRGTTGFVVWINGKPTQGDPMTLLSQFPANSIEKVELIATPGAQYDAEGKAGLIQITTKRGQAEGLYLQLNTRGGFPSIQSYGNKLSSYRYSGDFNLNYQKGPWNLALGGNYQRNDQAGRRIGEVVTYRQDTSTYFPSFGERSTDEVNYSTRLSLDFTPNPTSTFSLAFYAGRRTRIRTADILYDANYRLISGIKSPSFQYFNANQQERRGDFVLGSLDYSYSLKNEGKLISSFLMEYTQLGGPTSNRNLGYPDLTQVYQEEYNTNTNPLKGIRYNLDYQSPNRPWGILLFGFQYRYLDHFGDFYYERKNFKSGLWDLVPEFSSAVDLKREIHSGYLQWDKKLEKWKYGLGLRNEWMRRSFSLKDRLGSVDTTYRYAYVRPFFSGNLSYQARANLIWKLNFSQRVERETTFKMNPFPEREHSETLEQGDPNVLPEFIDQLELGMVKNWEESSFYATLYSTRIQNLVNRVNTVYNDSILNRIYSNVGTAQSYGLDLGAELFLAKKWKLFLGGNGYYYSIKGEFDQQQLNRGAWVYALNSTSTHSLSASWSAQFTLSYLSKRITAQGEDSRFYQPSLSVKKAWLDGRLALALQWQNLSLGLLDSNQQRISTWRKNEFFTSTNYIYEVDQLFLNLSYTINSNRNRSKFLKSEFGEKEF